MGINCVHGAHSFDAGAGVSRPFPGLVQETGQNINAISCECATTMYEFKCSASGARRALKTRSLLYVILMSSYRNHMGWPSEAISCDDANTNVYSNI